MRVQSQGSWRNVHKMWHCTCMGGGVRCSDKGKCLHYNFITWANTDHLKCNLECCSPIHNGNTMIDAANLSNLRLETVHVLANRRDPATIKTIFHQRPLRTHKFRLMQRCKSHRITAYYFPQPRNQRSELGFKFHIHDHCALSYIVLIAFVRPKICGILKPLSRLGEPTYKPFAFAMCRIPLEKLLGLLGTREKTFNF